MSGLGSFDSQIGCIMSLELRERQLDEMDAIEVRAGATTPPFSTHVCWHQVGTDSPHHVPSIRIRTQSSPRLSPAPPMCATVSRPSSARSSSAMTSTRRCRCAGTSRVAATPRSGTRHVRQLRHHFRPFIDHFSALPHLTRAVCCALLGDHADPGLIGAWNLMLCPIWGFRPRVHRVAYPGA